MPRQAIFAHGRYLGAREVSATWRSPDGFHRMTSAVLFCPQCGELWARFATEGSRLTACRTVSCLAHGDGRLFSGPLAPEWDPAAYSDDAPDAACALYLRSLLAQHDWESNPASAEFAYGNPFIHPSLRGPSP